MEKSSKINKRTPTFTPEYDPQSAGINVQSPQSESTPRRLTLTYLLQPFANKLPTFEQQFIPIYYADCGICS